MMLILKFRFLPFARWVPRACSASSGADPAAVASPNL